MSSLKELRELESQVEGYLEDWYKVCYRTREKELLDEVCRDYGQGYAAGFSEGVITSYETVLQDIRKLIRK